MPVALDSWLTKVRSAMSSATKGVPPGPKKSSVGILAFEVASLMSKLLHMWRAVGDAGIARLRHETINLDGVRKVVSDDDDFLLGLACAELVDALRAASDSVAALAARCADLGLREFRDAFLEFADTGRDRHRWAASSWKEMDTRAHKMEKQVANKVPGVEADDVIGTLAINSVLSDYKFQRNDLWKPVYLWLESLEIGSLVETKHISEWLMWNPKVMDRLVEKQSVCTRLIEADLLPSDAGKRDKGRVLTKHVSNVRVIADAD
ncbi:hypothetical protein EJB05_03123, partial [Eragrostis curvula]